MTKDEALKLALDFLMTRRMGAELVIDALQEALAQPEQEPVAEVVEDVTGYLSIRWYDDWAPNHGDKLYTTPPKRTWVGLTDEDLEFWTKELGQGELGQGVLRAVADHLKEENT